MVQCHPSCVDLQAVAKLGAIAELSAQDQEKRSGGNGSALSVAVFSMEIVIIQWVTNHFIGVIVIGMYFFNENYHFSKDRLIIRLPLGDLGGQKKKTQRLLMYDAMAQITDFIDMVTETHVVLLVDVDEFLVVNASAYVCGNQCTDLKRVGK